MPVLLLRSSKLNFTRILCLNHLISVMQRSLIINFQRRIYESSNACAFLMKPLRLVLIFTSLQIYFTTETSALCRSAVLLLNSRQVIKPTNVQVIQKFHIKGYTVRNITIWTRNYAKNNNYKFRAMAFYFLPLWCLDNMMNWLLFFYKFLHYFRQTRHDATN